MKHPSATTWLTLLATLLVCSNAIAQVLDQLPDPDSKPADQTKPVKVFVLLGQSNMLGFGRIDPSDKNGTLSYLVKTEKKYPHLIDDAGNWTVRQDVRNVHVMDKRGAGLTEFTTFQDVKNEWLTVTKGHIGPELQFGHIITPRLTWKPATPWAGRWRSC